MRVAVVGAGVGGLASAIALRQAGHDVVLLEASVHTGGSSAQVAFDGVTFDGGPSMLLDKPGLAWVFEHLGTRIEEHVELLPIEHPWRVTWHDGNKMDVYADLDRTARGFDAHAKGAAKHYKAYVARMTEMYERLAPLQRQASPGLADLLSWSRWPAIFFLRRPLEHHLRDAGLPLRVLEALGIWTRIAGQRFATAPAPMALVPAIVHGHGAYTVRGGMARIPEALTELAVARGVEVRCGARVDKIAAPSGKVRGVVVDGEHLPADAVVGNASALSILFELLEPAVPSHRASWGNLPLQGPGVNAYVTATHREQPFATFRLGTKDCGARILPGTTDETQAGRVRLMQPLRHGASAEQADASLKHLLESGWWQKDLDDIQVRGVHTPASAAEASNLYKESVGPVMTQDFMRAGRLPHRVPKVEGLFLAGSATHPGELFSSCAISGILAAGEVGGA